MWAMTSNVKNNVENNLCLMSGKVYFSDLMGAPYSGPEQLLTGFLTGLTELIQGLSELLQTSERRLLNRGLGIL